MSIRVESLEQHHVEALAGRMMDRHGSIATAMLENKSYAAMMCAAGPCAAFLYDGVVVACAGLVDFTPSNRCFIWCAFANDCGFIFAPLILRMRAAMRMFPRRRYEAYIDPEFSNGKRLVKWAKFRYEGLMKSFEGDGADRELWALIGRA
jgi:hypothetical protein